MGKLIPDPQIGGIGGILLWIFAVSVVIVALFTTGLGPVIIWALFMAAVVIVLYFVFARVFWRLKRGR